MRSVLLFFIPVFNFTLNGCVFAEKIATVIITTSVIIQTKNMPSGIKKNELRARAVSESKKILPIDGIRLKSKICEKTSKTGQNTGFHNLEAEILINIFSYFTEKELSSCISGVCRHWHSVARNPKLWKELEFKGTRFREILFDFTYIFVLFFCSSSTKSDKTDALTICNFLWKSRKLEKLSLSYMENPVTVIRQMCRCNRSLKSVKIRSCRGGDSGDKIPESVLRNILHSCRNLESLDLNGTQFSATRFYHELANLPKLKKLNLNNSKHLLAKDLVTIALNCRNLEDVSITRSENSLNSFQITDQDAIFFFKNLSKTLKRVDFDTTGLTGPSFEAILSCPNLKRLSLRHALFLSGEIFCNHISRLHGLRELRLTQARQLVSDDIMSISNKLVFGRLNLVDLSGCGRISDLGIRSLLECCKDGLIHLNLKSCKSIKDMNFIINNCTKLQFLNIAHCSSRDPSYLKNLTSNITKLKKLVIDDKTLSYSDLKTLQTHSPELKLIRSMSEFRKDELPVCLEQDKQ